MAKKLLAEAGFPRGFKTNVVAEAESDMGMLQIIKSYFAQVGIDMEIRTMPSEEWIDFVAKGHKHDQLAHKIVGPAWSFLGAEPRPCPVSEGSAY